MGEEMSQKYCSRCEGYVLALRQKPNHILHLLLSIITGGLWLLVWLFVVWGKSTTDWRCAQCGQELSRFQLKDVHANPFENIAFTKTGDYIGPIIKLAIPAIFAVTAAYGLVMDARAGAPISDLLILVCVLILCGGICFYYGKKFLAEINSEPMPTTPTVSRISPDDYK